MLTALWESQEVTSSCWESGKIKGFPLLEYVDRFNFGKWKSLCVFWPLLCLADLPMLSALVLHMLAICVVISYMWLCVCNCVCKQPWLPHCPVLVGDHFVTIAVGDQMANWALCHVTSLRWGLSQSAQARLLNCHPHRHHSPILTESSFRGPEGLFRNLTETLVTTVTASSQWLIYILSTWVVWKIVCVFSRVCSCRSVI